MEVGGHGSGSEVGEEGEANEQTASAWFKYAPSSPIANPTGPATRPL